VTAEPMKDTEKPTRRYLPRSIYLSPEMWAVIDRLAGAEMGNTSSVIRRLLAPLLLKRGRKVA
jgi:hypothetical protein